MIVGITAQILSGNWIFSLLLILAIIVTIIYYRKKKTGVRIYKNLLREQLRARKYEKDKYVTCPICKHLVDSELELCQNCGNQM